MEVEQWFFSRLLLDNFHLKREVIEMTEPLARLSRLWRSGSHSAVHPPSGTSSRTADTRSSASVSLKVSSDTAHSSQILAIARTYLSLHALEKLDCLALPFTREGSDGVTTCDRVYTD